MLALAKVEQLRQQQDGGVLDLDEAVRTVALDLSPLIAGKDIDFTIETSRHRCMRTRGCCRNWPGI